MVTTHITPALIPKSKGSVNQFMDDLDLINSVEQVEVMVNSIRKGAENQKTSTLVMLKCRNRPVAFYRSFKVSYSLVLLSTSNQRQMI